MSLVYHGTRSLELGGVSTPSLCQHDREIIGHPGVVGIKRPHEKVRTSIPRETLTITQPSCNQRRRGLTLRQSLGLRVSPSVKAHADPTAVIGDRLRRPYYRPRLWTARGSNAANRLWRFGCASVRPMFRRNLSLFFTPRSGFDFVGAHGL